jgi:hypothetical protein
MNNLTKFQVKHYTNICVLSFVSHFWKIQGSLNHAVGWQYRDIAKFLKVIAFSVKLQQACEGKAAFYSIVCPCKSKHSSLRHREAYIECSGWELLHDEQNFFKHTNGDITWMQNIRQSNWKTDL